MSKNFNVPNPLNARKIPHTNAIVYSGISNRARVKLFVPSDMNGFNADVLEHYDPEFGKLRIPVLDNGVSLKVQALQQHEERLALSSLVEGDVLGLRVEKRIEIARNRDYGASISSFVGGISRQEKYNAGLTVEEAILLIEGNFVEARTANAILNRELDKVRNNKEYDALKDLRSRDASRFVSEGDALSPITGELIYCTLDGILETEDVGESPVLHLMSSHSEVNRLLSELIMSNLQFGFDFFPDNVKVGSDIDHLVDLDAPKYPFPRLPFSTLFPFKVLGLEEGVAGLQKLPPSFYHMREKAIKKGAERMSLNPETQIVLENLALLTKAPAAAQYYFNVGRQFVQASLSNDIALRKYPQAMWLDNVRAMMFNVDSLNFSLDYIFKDLPSKFHRFSPLVKKVGGFKKSVELLKELRELNIGGWNLSFEGLQKTHLEKLKYDDISDQALDSHAEVYEDLVAARTDYLERITRARRVMISKTREIGYNPIGNAHDLARVNKKLKEMGFKIERTKGNFMGVLREQHALLYSSKMIKRRTNSLKKLILATLVPFLVLGASLGKEYVSNIIEARKTKQENFEYKVD